MPPAASVAGSYRRGGGSSKLSCQSLQAFGRGEYQQVAPAQFTTTQMPNVVCHDRPCPTSYSEFDKVIIALIGEIGPPAIVYFDPSSCCRQSGQHLTTLLIRCLLSPDLSAQQIFVFEPQRIREDWAIPPFQRSSHHLSRRAAARAESGHEHVGIDDDQRHADSIYATIITDFNVTWEEGAT